jgi:hypothetical protein
MRNPAVNYRKAIMPPRAGRIVRPPRAGRPLGVPRRRRDAAARAVGAPAPGWPHRFASRSLSESLNWYLCRYVRAFAADVWLMRRVPGTGGTADRAGARRAGGGPSVAAPGEHLARPKPGAASGSRTTDHAPRYRLYRNGQMEHCTQVAAGLRGDVRGGSAIAGRECATPQDLRLTTLGSKMTMQSNIFKFVMT